MVKKNEKSSCLETSACKSCKLVKLLNNLSLFVQVLNTFLQRVSIYIFGKYAPLYIDISLVFFTCLVFEARKKRGNFFYIFELEKRS